MNSQTRVFGEILSEIYEKTQENQDITLEEMMDDLKNKLSVIVEKES